MLTRIFKSGNSLAVRIPQELAFIDAAQDGIERCPPEDRGAADQAIKRLIARVPVLPFGEHDAHSFGVLVAAVPDRKRDAMDHLIAAHAVSTGCVLVTNNEADFRDYPGVQVENWALAA